MNDIKFVEIILPTTMQNIRCFQNEFIQTPCFHSHTKKDSLEAKQ